MVKKKKLVLLGLSGNTCDIIDFVRGSYNVVGILDDQASKQGLEFEGIKVIGKLQDASKMTNVCFINGIGSPRSYTRRQDIIHSLKIPLNRFETFVHPKAFVAPSAFLGRGVVVYPHCFIGSQAKIGNHVLILSNAVVNHNVQVGDGTCISSGASLSGGVLLGESCYVGTHASIKENLKVGDFSMIGMGAVVLNNVPSKKVFVGNPAKLLKGVKK